jgi:hypothetical protein
LFGADRKDVQKVEKGYVKWSVTSPVEGSESEGEWTPAAAEGPEEEPAPDTDTVESNETGDIMSAIHAVNVGMRINGSRRIALAEEEGQISFYGPDSPKVRQPMARNEGTTASLKAVAEAPAGKVWQSQHHESKKQPPKLAHASASPEGIVAHADATSDATSPKPFTASDNRGVKGNGESSVEEYADDSFDGDAGR